MKFSSFPLRSSHFKFRIPYRRFFRINQAPASSTRSNLPLLILRVPRSLAGILLSISLVLSAFRPGLLFSRATFSLFLSCSLTRVLPYVPRFAALLALFRCVARHRCYQQSRCDDQARYNTLKSSFTIHILAPRYEIYFAFTVQASQQQQLCRTPTQRSSAKHYRTPSCLFSVVHGKK